MPLYQYHHIQENQPFGENYHTHFRHCQHHQIISRHYHCDQIARQRDTRHDNQCNKATSQKGGCLEVSPHSYIGHVKCSGEHIISKCSEDVVELEEHRVRRGHSTNYVCSNTSREGNMSKGENENVIQQLADLIEELRKKIEELLAENDKERNSHFDDEMDWIPG
ncbi:hypothetical protein EJ08DRAFT_139197 [Tothia fuscella]|uniref:Uncharacterized protein n=1 Tax=Tothia fuscella TaxID=1048955 RepID=A0A9P4NV74_9PEZI|nr:hypothetical protein EJ08DRAFT_139197 [Tothia fuscella]